MPYLVASDTLLALVAGRRIATGSLPHHDTLTIWPHGATWVDQQWLGQLSMYEIHGVGGLRLVIELVGAGGRYAELFELQARAYR